LSDLKRIGTGKTGASRTRKKDAVPAAKSQPLEYPVATESSTPSTPLPEAQKSVSTPSPAVDSAITGQKLFEAAVKSYRQDDCRTALEQFDRYLADNSGSPLAADANLYKAECYLKLSAQ
jgi:TolA-binding protein